jgi:Tfp pilus assembly protein PilO
MRVTKREKILLIVLLFAAIGYAAYTFLVVPQWADIEAKEAEVQFWQRQREAVDQAPATLAALQEELTVIEEGMTEVGDKYFSMLNTQEEVILLMNELLSTQGVTDLSVSFSPVQEVRIESGVVNRQTVSVTLTSPYASLWQLLRSIWAFDEQIIVNSLSITGNEEGGLNVQTVLQLHDVSHITKVFNPLVYWFNIEDWVKDNPFTPLPGQFFPGIRYWLTSVTLDEMRNYIKFVDIRGHWAEEAIDAFGEERLVFGDGANRFFPDSPITRGEMVVLLDGYFQWPMPEDPIDLTNFVDYREIGSYSSTMARAVFKGFVSGYIVGYDDRTLRPNAPMSYEEFANVMSRIYGDPSFTWEAAAEEIFTATGFRSVGLTDISRPITKAEAVYYLYTQPTN